MIPPTAGTHSTPTKKNERKKNRVIVDTAIVKYGYKYSKLDIIVD